jgi:hypothetical protein
MASDSRFVGYHKGALHAMRLVNIFSVNRYIARIFVKDDHPAP